MKKFSLALLLVGATSFLVADGAALYKKCAGCHGANGEKKALGKSAVLTGLSVEKVIEDLKGYKAGTLNLHGMGGLMKGQVAALSDDDIKAIAEHVATFK